MSKFDPEKLTPEMLGRVFSAQRELIDKHDQIKLTLYEMMVSMCYHAPYAITQFKAEDLYKDWLDAMKQHYIIDGEWSQYHAMVAASKGWGLTQKQGMWEIVSNDPTKFVDDEAARQHVLAAEADAQHDEHMIAGFAVNAIMVGNVRG